MTDLTPSQTIGPYFAFGLTPKDYDFAQLIGHDLVTSDAAGERIRIEGIVYDGDGGPITDAMIEIWQADAQGRYADPRDARATNASFKGFGRCATDSNGLFSFHTVKPGAVGGPDGESQAPHVAVALFMRGQLNHLLTRIYFADESANAADPVLTQVPPDRRPTLIASRGAGDGVTVYRFDIHMQGDKETVFFDL